MSACAHDRPQRGGVDAVACPAPEAYPADPTLDDLIYALNDTYLAWEACREYVAGMR